MEAATAALVSHYSSLHLHENAIFLAERLLAEAPGEASKGLLAGALLASGAVRQAVTVLASCRSAGNRYSYARHLLELGHAPEAEDALMRGLSLQGARSGGPGWRKSLKKEAARGAVPQGAAGLHLLGLCALAGERREAAMGMEPTGRRTMARRGALGKNRPKAGSVSFMVVAPSIQLPCLFKV